MRVEFLIHFYRYSVLSRLSESGIECTGERQSSTSESGTYFSIVMKWSTGCVCVQLLPLSY